MLGLSVLFVVVLALGAVAAGMTPGVNSDPQVLLLLTTTAVVAAFWGWMALMMTPPFLSTAPTSDLHQAGRSFSAMTAAAVVLVAYGHASYRHTVARREADVSRPASPRSS